MPPGSPLQRKFGVVLGGKHEGAARQRFHDDWGALARAAGAGNAQAMRTFLITAGPHILRVVRRLLGSHHPDVEDVAQECAFALVDALPSFRGECSAIHFVCRISLLTGINSRRRLRAAKRAHEREGEGDEALEAVACALPGPDERFSSRLIDDIVRELLNTLPIEQAEALALHCVLGYTLGEMASSSGTSADTWKSRLRLAKHSLRRRVLADPRALELIAPWEGESP